MTRRQWAARELEIDENAGQEQARLAHRDLLTVWHPDQHASVRRIRVMAEEKCKRLNLAYEIFSGRDTQTMPPVAAIVVEDVKAERASAVAVAVRAEQAQRKTRPSGPPENGSRAGAEPMPTVDRPYGRVHPAGGEHDFDVFLWVLLIIAVVGAIVLLCVENG